MAVNGVLPSSDRWGPSEDMPNGYGSLGTQYYSSTNSFMSYNGVMSSGNYSVESFQQGPHVLSDAETIDLFHNAVYQAREEQAPEGNDKFEAALRVKKLTLDFKRRGIKSLPEEVIDIIKRDVDMIVLSHNHISILPPAFSECSSMTYLNLRGNTLDEFPPALLKLTGLQILDISRNKLDLLPEDINRMKSLRVLSISNNQIADLPLALGSMESLKLLKMAGNPWNDSLKTLLKAEDEATAASSVPVAEHENETRLTIQVKKYLRTEAAALDSGGESSSESPVDTPRPLKRNTSLRFPVNPVATTDSRSPSISKPVVPSKSHYRLASGQSANGQSTAPRRPGTSPIVAGNDRNRSNSESVLQAAQSSKSKRMGIVPKKSRLGTLEESRMSRNSLHFRGTSHNSALKEKHRQHIRSMSGTGSNSSNDLERASGHFFRRLSSLPEQRLEAQNFNTSIKGARTLLFSLHALDTYMSSLLHLASEDGSKRSSLERIFYNSTTQLQALDQSIQVFVENANDDERQRSQQARNIRRACKACLVAYSQLGQMLMKSSRHLVQNADTPYIRMFLVLIYSSNMEAGNAFHALGLEAEQPASQESISVNRGYVPKLAIPPAVSSQERPATSRRVRHDAGNTIRSQQSPPQYTNGKPPSQPQSAVPLYVNGRSRSNSRSSNFNASNVGSMANTPRSGDSFFIPQTPSFNMNDSNVNIGQSDGGGQDVMFERVVRAFQRVSEESQHAFTRVASDLDRRLERAKTNSENKTRLALWTTLAAHAREILDLCHRQSQELASINFYDPEVRNAPEFWHRLTAVGHSFVNFCGKLVKARVDYRTELLLNEIQKTINPCHKSFKAATNTLENSPWRNAMSNNPGGLNQLSVQTQWPSGGIGNGNIPSRLNGHRRTQGGSDSGSSPYMPTTPLSAALGPAAAATMPNANGSSNFDKSFQGDVFQRAAFALNSHPRPFRRN